MTLSGHLLIYLFLLAFSMFLPHVTLNVYCHLTVAKKTRMPDIRGLGSWVVHFLWLTLVFAVVLALIALHPKVQLNISIGFTNV